MIIPICLGILIGFSMIFDGYIENIFIVATTISIYTYIVYCEKDYKKLFLGFIISYFIVNLIIVFFIKDNIKIKSMESGDAQDETLVMLVYDGESKEYNAKERINEVYLKKGISGFLTGIYDLYKYKSYYKHLGKSEFKNDTYKISEGLRVKLGNKYKLIDSYMYTNPYFEKSIEEAIEIGYRKIIICPMFITEGKDFELLKKRLEKMKLNKYNINVKITDVLYKSDNLAKSYINEILENAKSNGLDSGIILIGLANENNLKQDIYFREKIRFYIEKEKNRKIQIKLPLLENNKDDIIKSGEQLLEYGIDILHVVIPTCTIDNMYNKNLVESILRELDTSGVRFHYIEPKDKANILINEIYNQILLI